MTEVNCSFIGVHVEMKICNYLICSPEKKRERKKERKKERKRERKREREKKRNQTKYTPSLSTSLLASTMSVFVLGNYGPSEFFLLMTLLY